MTYIDIFMIALLPVAVIYGWVRQQQWAADNESNTYSQWLKEKILRWPIDAFAVLILSSQLALLALALTFFFEHSPNPGGFIGLFLCAMSGATAALLFALKGFMWSWFYSQIALMFKNLW